MKKLLIITAALALFAAPAMATIVGGGHDMSAKGVGNATDSTNEVCVFCHTPHAAVAGGIPLANRTTTGSALCLSCHDGSVNYADISNKSNADLLNAGGADYSFTSAANLGAYAAANNHPVGVSFGLGVNGMVAANPTSGIIADGGTVTCSSCHDVHEPAGAPFLRVDNNGSGLCLECHEK